MTEDDRPSEDQSKDVVEGFDLPDAELTPPPEGLRSAEVPQAAEGAAAPALFEPHVQRAEHPPSVLPKLVALMVIPVIALGVILYLRHKGKQTLIDYKGECVETASKFLKGLSQDTAESVPAAYNLLHRELRATRATEFVMAEFEKATKGLGRFQSLGRARWEETAAKHASTSFSALARFEGGQYPVWFRFVRVTSGPKTVIQISDYKFGAR